MPIGPSSSFGVPMFGIGIDPGYEFCGVARMELASRKIVSYLTIETPRADELPQRLRRVYSALQDEITKPGVVAVGYENPLRTSAGKAKRHQTNTSSLILQRVVGYIEAICWNADIAMHSFEPQEVKKAVLGKGNADADKARVQHMVKVITGFFMGEHEADATATVYALAHRLAFEARLAHLHS